MLNKKDKTMKTLKNIFGILAILMIVLVSCDPSTDDVVPDDPNAKFNESGFFRDEWGTLIHKDAYDFGIKSSEMFSSKYIWILDCVKIGSPYNKTYPRNHVILKKIENIRNKADFAFNLHDFHASDDIEKIRLRLQVRLIHSDRRVNTPYFIWKVEFKRFYLMMSGSSWNQKAYDINLLKKDILSITPFGGENLKLETMYYHKELRKD